MNGIMVLLMLLMFTPPVAALFVLIKRLREEKFRNQYDAKDRFFESISLGNLNSGNDKKPLSEDKNQNTDNADLKKDSTDDNKNISQAAEKTEKTETPDSSLPEPEQTAKTPVNKNNSDEKNQNRIDKAEAAELVMDIMKRNSKKGNTDVQLQDMIELLKTGRDRK